MFWISIGALVIFYHIIKSAFVGAVQYPAKKEAARMYEREVYMRSRLIDDDLEAKYNREARNDAGAERGTRAQYFAPFLYGPDFELNSGNKFDYDYWLGMTDAPEKPYVMVKLAKHGKLPRQMICSGKCVSPKLREEFELFLLRIEEEINRHNPDMKITAVIDESESMAYHIVVPLRSYVEQHGYGHTNAKWHYRWQDQQTGLIL